MHLNAHQLCYTEHISYKNRAQLLTEDISPAVLMKFQEVRDVIL